MKTILIINAHQRYENFSEGKLNHTMTDVAKAFFKAKQCQVLETKIESGYDLMDEVEKHLQADLVILQTPVFWFSAPWIYKKYVDEVFNAGMFTQKMLTDDGRTRQDPSKQYGSGGKMQGKQFMISATWNAPKESFNNTHQLLFEGKDPRDVFSWISLNYRFCGFDILPGFNCFDVLKNPQIDSDIEQYTQHLETIFQTR